MKLITFTVPCYNSQGYMKKCIDSLLTGGDDVEIVIVNDDSRDDTPLIAADYAEKYPNIVKVVDKENGGHGSGINAGLKQATGRYFKVIDSDDWVNPDALAKLIQTIKDHIQADELPDLYITNFVYCKVGEKEYVSSYETKMPEGKMIAWDKIKRFKYAHMLLMHALMYRLDKLKESKVVLPEHTFYVDNLYAYQPMPYTRKIFYLNVNLYCYYIGRSDQSVNSKNIVARYDQQIRVMRHMVDAHKLSEVNSQPKGLKRYMRHTLNCVMITTVFFTGAENTPERKKALAELWEYIKAHDKKMYKFLRWHSYTTFAYMFDWRVRSKVMWWFYKHYCNTLHLG